MTKPVVVTTELVPGPHGELMLKLDHVAVPQLGHVGGAIKPAFEDFPDAEPTRVARYVSAALTLELLQFAGTGTDAEQASSLIADLQAAANSHWDGLSLAEKVEAQGRLTAELNLAKDAIDNSEEA